MDAKNGERLTFSLGGKRIFSAKYCPRRAIHYFAQFCAKFGASSGKSGYSQGSRKSTRATSIIPYKCVQHSYITISISSALQNVYLY